MMGRFRCLLCRAAVAAIFTCAAGARAEPPSAVTTLPQWVLRAQERLGLQPGQQSELRVLIDANAERLREVHARFPDARTSQSRRAQLEAMSGLQYQFRDELRGILTPAQLAEWDTLIEELLGQVHLRNTPRLVGNTH